MGTDIDGLGIGIDALDNFLKADDREQLDEIMRLLAKFCTRRGFALVALVQVADASGMESVPELRVSAVPEGFTLTAAMELITEAVHDDEFGCMPDHEIARREQASAITRMQELHGTGMEN